VVAIAQASPRLEALHFRVADYVASCGARSVNIGVLKPDYPGDRWYDGSRGRTQAASDDGTRLFCTGVHARRGPARKAPVPRGAAFTPRSA